MEQLCVYLLPGDGITAEQLQKATVHLKHCLLYTSHIQMQVRTERVSGVSA